MTQRFNAEVDYYEILQVHPNAHQEVIKRAYRTIVRLLQAHPDLGGNHEDAIRVNEAYATLSDPVLREAYDRARRLRMTPSSYREAPHSPSTPSPPAAAPAATATATARKPRPAAPPPPPRAASPRKTKTVVPPAEEPMQTIYCPRCGARNRLPQMAPLTKAVCGKCHRPLAERRTTATDPHLPTEPVKLSESLVEQLGQRGELRLARAQMPTDRRLYCQRCYHAWTAAAETLPTRCPQCGDPRWSDFRLFRCRFCEHQFRSNNLVLWPYWLFPTCPACRMKHWHGGCEKHPLRWLLNPLNRMGR